MYAIKTKYRRQGEGVVGHSFETIGEAERFLTANGWERNPYGTDWWKEGQTMQAGMLAIGIAHYVYIDEE